MINLNPFTEVWKNTLTTNCYAYALGIDIPYNEINENGYLPGVFSNNTLLRDCYTSKQFYDRVEADLESLNISYKYIYGDYTLKDNEWLIAFFLKEKIPYIYTNFHVIKKVGDIWLDKSGYKGESGKIKCVDPAKYKIADAALNPYKYSKTLCLKMNVR